jgi:hypothetical protein
VLSLAEILLTAANRQDLLRAFPAWSLFPNPVLATVYLILTRFAFWMVLRLRSLSVLIFDSAFETQFDLNGWRVVHLTPSHHPMLFVGTWRYRMKWWFKTNWEPLNALTTRMLIDCPTFGEFERRVRADEYPPAFAYRLAFHPYGRLIGNVRQIMQRDVLERVFRANSLWQLWQGERHPESGQLITTRDEMASMLYAELRSLILCPVCRGVSPEQDATCRACAGSGAVMAWCEECHGLGVNARKQACMHCNGLGLQNQPIPGTYLDRLQYLWTARNIDLLKGTFPVWLSYRSYFYIFSASSVLFLGLSLILQQNFDFGLLVNALLFGSAILFGLIGMFIAIVFSTAFNSSGALVVSYPLTYSKYGNYIWIELMRLIGWLTFGLILFDMVFAVSQFLFVSHFAFGLGTVLIGLVALAFEAISIGGFFSLHAAMRDAKRSQMDELAAWLSRALQEDYYADTSREEEFYKEMRDLQEWPLNIGLISNIVLPIVLTIGSLLLGYVIQRQ